MLHKKKTFLFKKKPTMDCRQFCSKKRAPPCNPVYCRGPVGATGATGPAGQTGALLPSGVNYSDYLFWNGASWAVGDSQVHLGAHAGEVSQGGNAVALGNNAGNSGQKNDCIAVGTQAGETEQGIYNIAIGYQAGQTGQLSYSIAIGCEAAQTDQGDSCIAIGNGAGETSQESGAIAIGYTAGLVGQKTQAIAIGTVSGGTDKGKGAIAIGTNAGFTGQKDDAIAIGSATGKTDQGAQGIAIGRNAGNVSQGEAAIAIGDNAGIAGQGVQSVAIGCSAGSASLGDYSIAIGNGAETTVARSIVLNADSGPLPAPVATQGFFVNPVRADLSAGNSHGVYYDPTTCEIRYEAAKTFVIDHPTDADRYLVHACLEGPEAGVYYRGEGELVDCKTWVQLPDYVSWLATNFTVQLTQISRSEDEGFARLRAGRVVDGRFAVYGDPCAFAWHVHGLRQHLETEPLRAQVEVRGDGPYRYIA